jgi:hypothetical protein
MYTLLRNMLEVRNIGCEFTLPLYCHALPIIKSVSLVLKFNVIEFAIKSLNAVALYICQF